SRAACCVGAANRARDRAAPAAGGPHQDEVAGARALVAPHLEGAPALEERSRRERRAAALEHADEVRRLRAPGLRHSPSWTAWTMSPRPVASVLSAWLRGGWRTTTFGVSPAPRLVPPPPRFLPEGVKYSPTVMSSAPPFSSGSIYWKTPLPQQR